MKSVFVAGLFALTMATAVPAIAEDNTMHRLMTLNGHGEVRKAPDMAFINIGVTTTAETAKQALADNTTKMTAVLATIKSAGVEDKDIQTSDFAINPRIDYGNNSSSPPQPPRTIGYDVTNNVSLSVRKIETLGELLDKVVESGSNQINGIQFSVSDPDIALDKARTVAVADARRKAELYAKAAGVTLGDIVSISEASAGPGPVVMRAKAAMMAEGAPAPIAGGEQTLSMDVNITWSIK